MSTRLAEIGAAIEGAPTLSSVQFELLEVALMAVFTGVNVAWAGAAVTA